MFCHKIGLPPPPPETSSVPAGRSSATSTRPAVSTGVAMITSRAVAIMAHTNRGRRQMVMPGARMVTVVVTKLMAPMMEEDPQEGHPRAVVGHEPVVFSAVEQIDARLAELRAHHHGQRTADQEEREGGDQILDADHLVIGVPGDVATQRLESAARRGLGRGHALPPNLLAHARRRQVLRPAEENKRFTHWPPPGRPSRLQSRPGCAPRPG